MYTQCPECLTIYEIDEVVLQTSLGLVRCGHCGSRFDALRTLSDTLPDTRGAALSEHEPAERAPILTAEVPARAFEQSREGRHTTVVEAASARDAERRAEPGPPDATSAAPAAENADDWFADIESELAATATAEAPDVTLGSDEPWAVEMPDDTEAFEPRTGPATTDVDDPGFAPADGQEPVPPARAREAADATPSGSEPEMDDATARGLADSLHDEYEPEPARPGATTGAAEPDEEPQEDLPDGPARAESDQPSEVEAEAAQIRTPLYVRPRRRASRKNVIWTVSCIVLALILAGQLVWASRVDLYKNPATHPWIVRLCAHVPCHLPPIRDPAKLELLSRAVRADPGAAGALMITATFRNDADFTQPWPVVVIEFRGIHDDPVAMRRVRPAEYLTDHAKRAAGIAPGTTVAVAFKVADPGKRATSYQFRFE